MQVNTEPVLSILLLIKGDLTDLCVYFIPGDIQQHLQTMFTLLRPEDNIKLVGRHTHTHTRAYLWT